MFDCVENLPVVVERLSQSGSFCAFLVRPRGLLKMIQVLREVISKAGDLPLVNRIWINNKKLHRTLYEKVHEILDFRSGDGGCRVVSQIVSHFLQGRRDR